jgi:uncharacterized membrane protein
MLIPFPIVCFIGAFVTDIVYNSSNDQGWATASFWLLGIGLLMAALAAVAGLTDFLGDDAIESAIKTIYKLGGLTTRQIRTKLGLNKTNYNKTSANRT